MTRPPHESTGTGAGTEYLTESESRRLFREERRRTALDVLADRTVPVELDDVAAAVAERENGDSPADAESVERVALSLHHVHLPKMADFGVVDYDTDATRIEWFPGGFTS